MAILRKKDKNYYIFFVKKTNNEKYKHNLYSDVVKKLMFISSPMLCGSHFCPFSPISQVEQWPQAKRAATYQAKC
jgi:hypothetical protein